jgi:phosphopantetheinyl transferase
MVHEAEALEKPGRPTFFETPAWSFNMGIFLSWLGVGLEKATGVGA